MARGGGTQVLSAEQRCSGSVSSVVAGVPRLS